MQVAKSKLKQPKTTINGGYRSKMLAPVMAKPPPNTNTFPVSSNKQHQDKKNQTQKSRSLNLPGKQNVDGDDQIP
jgi:hypothetical protein